MSTSIVAESGTFQIGGTTTVNRLGYGTMQLPGKGVWGDPEDPAGAVRVLQRAVELGVTLIDTADSYGPFVAEQLIQKALAWLLKRSPVMLPIPGTSSVSHLEENLAAAGLELTDEQFDALGSAAVAT